MKALKEKTFTREDFIINSLKEYMEYDKDNNMVIKSTDGKTLVAPFQTTFYKINHRIFFKLNGKKMMYKNSYILPFGYQLNKKEVREQAIAVINENVTSYAPENFEFDDESFKKFDEARKIFVDNVRKSYIR